MPTLELSVILAFCFSHTFICGAVDITVLIQSILLYGDETSHSAVNTVLYLSLELTLTILSSVIWREGL